MLQINGDIIQWDQSNRAYTVTHGVSGIDWKHSKHPLLKTCMMSTGNIGKVQDLYRIPNSQNISELEPAGGYRPRRITQAEIQASFQKGWHINYIKSAAFDSWLRSTGPRAWLSSIAKSVEQSEQLASVSKASVFGVSTLIASLMLLNPRNRRSSARGE